MNTRKLTVLTAITGILALGEFASAAGLHPRHRLFGQATPGPGHHPTTPPDSPALGRSRNGKKTDGTP